MTSPSPAVSKHPVPDFDEEVCLYARALVDGRSPVDYLINRIREWDLDEKGVAEIIAHRCW